MEVPLPVRKRFLTYNDHNHFSHTTNEVHVKQMLILLCGTLFMLFLSGSRATAQVPKIGYVNSAKVLQEFPEAQEAQKKLDAMGKGWQAELERMDKELQ